MFRKLGVAFTAIYLLAIAALVFLNWSTFSELEPNAWGDFIAGTVGPLALIWVILGFFLQSTELRNSVEALKLQSEELAKSVEQQTALVKVSEAQHKLELEAANQRWEEDARRKEREANALEAQELREVPFLVLKPLTGGSSSGNFYQKFQFRNRSGDAQRIQIETGNPEITASPTETFDIFKGQTFDLIVNSARPFGKFGAEAKLMLKSASISGKMRVQEFDLQSRPFRQIKEYVLNHA